MSATPWWDSSSPPWVCTGCGDDFGCACHLTGRWLCADPMCTRKCERCFVAAQMHNELCQLIKSVEGG